MGNTISNTSQGSPVTENRRMEAKQVYEHITGPHGRSIVELAGAPVDGEWIKGAIESRGTLFLQGELKSLGQGDTASNFRFKTDKDKNNVVVSNLTELFKLYHEQQKNKETPEPVVVTSVPRKMRTQVYHMGKCEVDSRVTATGEIWVSSSTAEDPTTQRLTTETETIQKFIEKMGIEVEFA